MTTVREKMEEMLYQNGLFEDQAKEIMDIAVESDSFESMKENWNKDASGYPPIIINICWVGVKGVALKWIDNNVPEAWFRDVFSQ